MNTDPRTLNEYRNLIPFRIADGRLATTGATFSALTTLVSSGVAITQAPKLHETGQEAGNAGVAVYAGVIFALVSAVATYAFTRAARAEYKQASTMERILNEAGQP